jgi:hypothetical protein
MESYAEEQLWVHLSAWLTFEERHHGEIFEPRRSIPTPRTAGAKFWRLALDATHLPIPLSG